MSNKIIIVNRLNWIDWAKTIAILFVVFGHIPEKNGSFWISYTYLFHMPLFFFISGFLTKKEFFCSTTLKKYWHTLIIPYFCYNIVFYPYWTVKHIIDFPNAGWFDFIRPLIGTVLLQLSTPISVCLNGVTWFISALLVMKIILSICNNHKYGLRFMTILAILAALLYIYNEHYRLYTNFPLVGFVRCLPYFFIGYLCNQNNIIQKRPQKKDYFICIAGITISLIACTYGRTSNGLIAFGIYSWIISIAAIGGLLSFCKLLDKVHLSIIDNVSIGTVVIMGLHWILIGVTNFTLQKLLHISNIVYPLWVAIALTLLFTAIIYPVILFFKNNYPFMLGKQSTKVKTDNTSNVNTPFI